MEAFFSTCFYRSQLTLIKYIIGTLSFNTKENQLYFLLHWPLECEDTQLNLNKQQITSRIDKISFHKDSIHIKVSEITSKGKKKQRLGKINRLLFPIKPEVTMLYAESFMLKNNPTILLPTSSNLKNDWKVETECTIATIPIALDFSLIFILTPNSISTESIFQHSIIKFNDLQIRLSNFSEQGHSIERIMAFDNYDLIVFTIPRAYELINTQDNIPDGPMRIPNFKDPVQSLIRTIIKN